MEVWSPRGLNMPLDDVVSEADSDELRGDGSHKKVENFNLLLN